MSRTCLALFVSFSIVGCAASAAPEPSEPPPAAASATPPAPVRAPGSAQVSGTVDGNAITMLDAVLVPGTHGARVLLVDRTDYCEHTDVEKSGSHTLTFDLGPKGATSADPGDYQVVEAFDDDSRALDARLDVVGQACSGTKQYMSHSGSATITDSSATKIAGSFTLALGSDTVTGTFVATSCLAPAPPTTMHCED